MNGIDAIRSTLTRWLQADDAGRDEEWVEGYLTEDFEFSVGDRRYAGRDDIRRLNAARAEGPPRGVHILSEPAIDVDGDTARARTPFVYVTAADGGYRILLAGLYDDRFVRDRAGTWRCRARVTTHLSAPAAADGATRHGE